MSTKEERLSAKVFWVVVIISLIGLYAMSSIECARGNDCSIANADLGHWLFPKK